MPARATIKKPARSRAAPKTTSAELMAKGTKKPKAKMKGVHHAFGDRDEQIAVETPSEPTMLPIEKVHGALEDDGVPYSTITKFLEGHSQTRVVPDAQAAVLKRPEIDKGLLKDKTRISKGVTIVPVFNNSLVSVAVMVLAGGTTHGPYRNPTGYVMCRVSKAGNEALEYSVGEGYVKCVGEGAHLLIPPYQPFYFKNKSRKKIEISLTISQPFPEFDPSSLEESSVQE